MSEFEAWFAANLPDVTHFTAAEFLVKGADHYNPRAAGYGLNADPPRELWPNVIPLARALEAFRVRVGKPVHINSCYRSPRYNATLPGAATSSQHMQFKAADITVAGRGSPADWAATARAMRADGLFAGGVGEYKSFVHIDVRGAAADWAGAGVTPFRGTVLEPAARQTRLTPPPEVPAVADGNEPEEPRSPAPFPPPPDIPAPEPLLPPGQSATGNASGLAAGAGVGVAAILAIIGKVALWVVILAALAAAGYALWRNRDRVKAFFGRRRR